MGGGYEISLDTSSDVVGIIPRVIKQLYEGIDESSDYSYVVRVSYLEVVHPYAMVYQLLCVQQQCLIFIIIYGLYTVLQLHSRDVFAY